MPGRAGPGPDRVCGDLGPTVTARGTAISAANLKRRRARELRRRRGPGVAGPGARRPEAWSHWHRAVRTKRSGDRDSTVTESP